MIEMYFYLTSPNPTISSPHSTLKSWGFFCLFVFCLLVASQRFNIEYSLYRLPAQGHLNSTQLSSKMLRLKGGINLPY